jgi:pseudaminic acid synthase
VLVGLSDHSSSLAIPVASVVLGARIIEKHFILDKNIGGPDAAFSLNVDEFRGMVNAVRETEKALGKVTYELSPKVLKSREHSRSLFIVKDMKEGDVFSPENIRSIRPGYGLHTKHYAEVIGKKVSRDIEKGTPLCWELIK